MPSRTDPLRNGMGYPLKPSWIVELMEEEAVSIEWHLVRGGDGELFECFFWPPNPNVPHERLYLRSSAVPSAEVADARAHLLHHDIPSFRAWLKALLSLPLESTHRQREQYFACTYKGLKGQP